ncbi:hypothetical protein BCR39DRAFT_105254 [Naematelia encephala]|uniref:Uncharacterized protein n=1 Tax=Naematelia encephala TaxID=71784 RepID=A0A1Y2B9M3_9TREE|nr:hypothetical protein BCR39DRAFT_105254 [Naematelia encephala]
MSHDRCSKLENRVSTYMSLVDNISKRDKTMESIAPTDTHRKIGDPKRTLPLGSRSPDSIRSFPATQEGDLNEQSLAENSSRRDLGKRRFETLESLTEEPDDRPTKNSKATTSSSTTRKHTLRKASMGSTESVVPPIATQNPEKIGKVRGRSSVRFADKN